MSSQHDDNEDPVEVELEKEKYIQDTTLPFAGEKTDNNVETMQKDNPTKESIPVKVSKFTARNPLRCLLGSLVFASIISFIGLYVGEFRIEVDNKGWRSRGTKIANREMQNDIVIRLRDDLFEDEDGSVWDDAENNIVRGFILLEDRNSDEEQKEGEKVECGASRYYATMLAQDNMFAAYEAQNGKSILDPDVLFEICESETKTFEVLDERNLCSKCDDDSECLPPMSLLWILRLNYGKLDSSCSELKDFYTGDVQEEFTDSLVQCTQDILSSYDSMTQSYDAPNCPVGFQPNLVDTGFGIGGNKELKYSSSYFFTYDVNENDLYAARPDYGLTDETLVTSVYDTLWEVQNTIYVDSVLLQDMSLAVGSMIITITAMGIHTKSMWLTLIGIFQIIFSVPLAYFVYYFIVGLRFFPFLNFIGIFVAAALGADYIFVTVDKWKNARLEDQSATTEEIAAIALPSSASAMFLTTSTTAVAFFATTICPVTPVLCFTLFCGLLIVFNYVMNILILFPALCLYDIWLMRGSRNLLVNCGCCSKSIFENRAIEGKEDGEKETSLIHKILSGLYALIHKFRYILFAACLIATGVSIYFALTIRLPDSVDVRLLPEDHVYEKHFAWKKELLSFPLFYAGGSSGEVSWGLRPIDNGVRNDPDSLSTLTLDDTFDPSTTESQTYLLGFCDRLFDSGIALPLNNEYECPINEFDSWLRNQTALPDANKSDAYLSSCDNSESIPMAEDQFDECIIAWSELTQNKNILEKRGKVKILRTKIKNSVGWDAPFSKMDEFWKKFESFMDDERQSAPDGVNKAFHTAGAFWWYDTNISMLQTAIGAALIAICFSAFVVFISSRSFPLTLMGAFCITYVLAATTSSLVGFGWDLGFLESVCFAILIGISCDFVIHFGHAYNHLPGDTSNQVRTKFAVIHMGPSILAAAFTTFASATVMLFCIVTFFTKFAMILLMTILHASVGSFIIYLTMTECFGPSEPTKLIDSLFSKCFGKEEEVEEVEEKAQTKREFYDLS